MSLLAHIASSVASGRHVVADRVIEPGTLVCREAPLASILHAEKQSSLCSFCWNAASASGELSRCGGCRMTRYCSRECQRLHWAQHRPECAAIGSFVKKHQRFPSPQLVLCARVLRTKLALAPAAESAKTALTLDTESPCTYAQFASLVDNWQVQPDENKSNLGSISMIVRELLLADEWARLVEQKHAELVAATDCSGQSRESDGVNAEGALNREIVLALAKFQCNNWTVCDGEFIALGSGVFPRVAMLNHSCRPNSSVSYIMRASGGPIAEVRAIERIQPGQEVTLAYIDLAAALPRRREALQAGYCFHCQCARCTEAERVGSDEWERDRMTSAYIWPHAPRHDAPRLASPAIAKPCSGYASPLPTHWTCSACDATLDFAAAQRIIDAATAATQLHERAVALRDGPSSAAVSDAGSRDAIKLFQECVRQRRALLHPMHSDLASSVNAVTMLLVDVRDFLEAAQWTRVALQWYEFAYRPTSPLLALHRLLYARLLWFRACDLDEERDREQREQSPASSKIMRVQLADGAVSVSAPFPDRSTSIDCLLREAVPHLETAIGVLRGSHGEAHALVADARRTIAEARSKIECERSRA